ncbi:ribonucleotide-diphosphate reductase subunit alpha [Caldimicrobium thiodismutans]|uniref:Vitamin B12-dependent ribonucleotide reductase n=1 Tax=Caldimicrobium thiodismutans TaxID=1653476 RepID=A0A0U5B3P6_9BACT|nr:adenosylcobalamin-dependent ribonucleoside-diphosphate reductase [Caldimicrobium thiodismutans]BAU22656.1 ribonucleotide-diphosphate reductase subunit alpha [Caldimicrobium thiodismutans]
MKRRKITPKLKESALIVLQARYLVRDEENQIVETPEALFERVAFSVAEGEKNFRKSSSKWEYYGERFYELMAALDFLPNSPTLMNAGRPLGQLSACFVLPVYDSLDSIFETLKYAALIHKSGGGTGFNFSRLRPKGDIVFSTSGVASGPVSFMQVYDSATEAIKQGGKRRGANMGILNVDHPDIEEFITIKSTTGVLTNFNISVGIKDNFIEALKKGEPYALINPRTGKVVTEVSSQKLFDLLVEKAWETGDPGVIFLDTINRFNPTPNLGHIEATNPCGEQPLLPFESCNLGSINLANFVKDGDLDWDRLKETIELAVRFLDDVIEVNRFPLPQIAKITTLNRKIGLGVMGFADMLIKLRIAYSEERALEIAEKVMSFINQESLRASAVLAEERGAFPAFPGSLWDQWGYPPLRNATTTTIAPTGTLSLIAGVSSSIEPLFGIYYERKTLGGIIIKEVHPLFEEILSEEGYSEREIEALQAEIMEKGLISKINLKEPLKKLFLTAFEISPDIHLSIQRIFQKYTHNAVSKTINLPEDTTPEEIKRIYLTAYEWGLKGVTVYRYGSKPEQVIYIKKGEGGKMVCPKCGEDLEVHGTCLFCGSCGYDKCQ